MVRKPAVSGSFYESSPTELSARLMALGVDSSPGSCDAWGVIAPHAGYSFCGEVAAKLYSTVNVPDRVLVLGPNHTGLGLVASIAGFSGWKTPLGTVQADPEMTTLLSKNCKKLEIDNVAHMEEHSIEVQLPFLSTRNPRVAISAICFRSMSYESCSQIARAISSTIVELGRDVLVVASSDMNHHEPARVAMRKDRMALERIESLDGKGLYNSVVEHHISMCGYIPAVIAIEIAKKMGAKTAEVPFYATSEDVNGDSSSVVGYAGVIFGKNQRKSIKSSLSDMGGPLDVLSAFKGSR